MPEETAGGGRPYVFISYRRDVEPDHTVAATVFQALRQQCDVFIDQVLPAEANWGKQIDEALHRTDCFIVFLSAESVASEMVGAEIETAYHLHREQNGRPLIIPVRLAYEALFPYPVSAYLYNLNWISWQRHEDTPHLLDHLNRAISDRSLVHTEPPTTSPEPSQDDSQTIPQPLASAQPVPLEVPEGTMAPQSAFYIERPEDRKALEGLQQQGGIIHIKGPRQMGKSSLLIRLATAAARQGKNVAFLDFQLFDTTALQDADAFFRHFCVWLTDELDLADRVDEYWQRPIGNVQRCTRYVRRHLLQESDTPLVFAMDEVDRVFDTAFRSDFFGMLRSWYNSRALEPMWRKLDLLLVTSTERYQLIGDLNQSPFNVGETVDLTDLTADQVAELNHLHGSPLTQDQEQALMDLLGGHPYLVRRALYLVAGQHLAAEALFANASNARGPFGDHLRYHLYRVQGQADLVQGLHQVLNSNARPDESVFFRLRGAGLIRERGHAVVPRCTLYARFFQEYLRG